MHKVVSVKWVTGVVFYLKLYAMLDTIFFFYLVGFSGLDWEAIWTWHVNTGLNIGIKVHWPCASNIVYIGHNKYKIL